MHDVVIVGGGPAGLTAALVLGRSRRDALVFDSGSYRNEVSQAVHGFPTRGATSPAELRRLAIGELREYPTIRIRYESIVAAMRDGDTFVISTARPEWLRARAIILATGLEDVLPGFAGARALHGTHVFPCPYCDGWEHRDTPLAAYTHGDDAGARYALLLARWSDDVVVFAEGPTAISPPLRALLEARRIRVDERRIVRASADGAALRLELDRGDPVTRRALFYHLGSRRHTALAQQLGCELDAQGGVRVDRLQRTSVAGVFVAGDLSRDVLQAVVAAGEGSAAGIRANEWLCGEESRVG
jgi:thioredoxin reductase